MNFQRAAVLFGCVVLCTGARGDDFDALRLKWKDLITGGTNYSLSDSQVRSRLQSITNAANSQWTSMDKTGTKPYLWSDLSSTTVSAQIVTAYSRLQSMALGYATYGSLLRSNAALAADIQKGLDWMYANRYNESKAEYDNWFHWEIGAPLQIVNIAVLMYEALGMAGLSNSLNALEHFTPSPTNHGLAGTFTGANLADRIRAVGVRGAVVKDAAKLVAAREAMSNIFPYVTTGDGYYIDGSFVQHTAQAYTGGYGYVLLGDLAILLPWFDGSAWALSDPAQTNVIQWVYNAYEPLIYRGAMMDMTRQRGVSRSGSPDHAIGHNIMQSILALSVFGTSSDQLRMKRMVKYWAQTDTSRDFVSNTPLPLLSTAQKLMQDSTIQPRGELTGHWTFASMDRIVHLRPGWGFGIAMSSSRIYNYECMNGENLKGWFQGDGACWMYNGDLSQYTVFWPTVDPFGLPGTTVDMTARADGYGTTKKTGQSWVGGVTLGEYGAAGMQLAPYGSTLRGAKSWFMFDNEVVCLGAGITSGESAGVRTTVENRKISAQNTNVLSIDGITMPTTIGWSTNRSGTTSLFLAGSGGYYFPGSARVTVQRQARTGTWQSINTGGSSTSFTSNYVTIALDHATKPTNATYAYALLPNATASQVSAYAAAPNFTILENSTNIQAVKETALGIVAANFWQSGGGTADVITSSNKASVIVSQTGQELSVACSDPTQLSGTVKLSLARAAGRLISADPAVQVLQLAPSIQLSVNTSGSAGRSYFARFEVANQAPVISSFNHSIVEEDTSSGPIAFTVSDDSTPAANLTVSAAASNTNLLPASSFTFTGADTVRFVSILPSTNQTGTSTVWIMVSDGTLTSSNGFQLTVTPVNDAPTIAPIANEVVNPGAPIARTLQATDPEAPPQSLYWYLISAPAGASLGLTSGAFYWRPAVANAASSNYVRARVVDNGSPALMATQSFAIFVNPLVIPAFGPIESDASAVSMIVNGQTGPDYYLESSTNLVNWGVIAVTNPVLMPFRFSDPASSNTPKSFYRIRLGP